MTTTAINPTTMIFINSKNRLQGTPYDFTINFNNDLIKAPKDCFIQLNVEQVSLNRSWYSIQEGLNTFDITNSNGGYIRITLPPGYYNAADLRVQLQTQLTGFIISYDKKLNKFSFTALDFSGGVVWWKFTFTVGSISDMFGFNQTEIPTMTLANPTVVSTKPIKVNADASVVIHTNIPRQKLSALDNFAQQTITESDVLCVVPINAPPFDNIIYNRNNTCDFTYTVLAPAIHGLRIYITNEQNTVLKLPYDFNMTLSVQYIPFSPDDAKPVLEDMRDMMRLYMLQNVAHDE